jgi:AraC-like DNA-binding protein
MASPIVRKHVVAGSAEPLGSGLFSMTHAYALSTAAGWMTVETLPCDQSNVSLSRVTSTGHFIDLTEAERFSVILPLNGKIEVDTAESRYAATPGEALVFGPNCRRTWVRTDNSRPYDALVLLAPAWMCRLPGDVRPPHQVIRSDLQQVSSLSRQLGGMIDRAREPASGDFSRIAGPAPVDRVLALLLDMLGAASDSVNDAQGNLGQECQRALDFIHTCYADPLSLTDIASAAGTSPRMLQLKFQRDFGRTPIDVLRQVRLAAVRSRLKEPGQSSGITRLALECGFAHLGRFAIAYRQTYGELPSQTARGTAMSDGLKRAVFPGG